MSKEAISTERALKLALEALEWINRVNAMDFEYQRKARESLNAIYEALAEQPAQHEDPCPGCLKGGVCRTPKCGRLKLPADHPYRTEQLDDIADIIAGELKVSRGHAYDMMRDALAAAQRKPLTEEQIDSIVAMSCKKDSSHLDAARVARAIEAAHGIKENK